MVEEVLVLKYFTEVECFNSIHILHAAISYLLILMFIAMNVVTLRCNYEARFHKDPFCKYNLFNNRYRTNSYSQINALIAKIVYIFSFTFFNQEEYYWFLSIVLLAFSSFVFSSFVTNRPYYLSFA
jgi:hypothetical protein